MSANWETLWDEIEKAGNVERYVQQQLELKGFVVKRRATDTLSTRELENSKKKHGKHIAPRISSIWGQAFIGVMIAVTTVGICKMRKNAC
jgi:hypothetical protein